VAGVKVDAQQDGLAVNCSPPCSRAGHLRNVKRTDSGSVTPVVSSTAGYATPSFTA